MRIDWNSLPTEQGMRPGAVRQTIAGDLLSAVRVVTTSDASFEESALHSHDNEQLLIMVSGKLELEVDGSRYWVAAGDLAYFKAGSIHGAVGVGEEGAIYYEVFSPPRYDQLPGHVGTSPLRFA